MRFSHVRLHDGVGFAREAAVETMQVDPGHSQLTVRVILAAAVQIREHLEMVEFDARKFFDRGDDGRRYNRRHLIAFREFE